MPNFDRVCIECEGIIVLSMCELGWVSEDCMILVLKVDDFDVVVEE